MNSTYYGIIQLIKSAITNEPATLPDGFDWESAIDIASHHKIEVLVYYGTFFSKIKVPQEQEGTLKKCVFSQISLDTQQVYEIKRLCNTFNNKGISFLPLKGSVIKSYYPKSEMRYMGDIDFLIQPSELHGITAAMQELGYGFELESNHEYIWIKSPICVELHKMLIPSYNKDYSSYYGDGWQLAKPLDGEYAMSDEDFFIYLLTHLAKHYRDAGIGIKQFIDFWVYREKKPNLDEKYLEAELKKLQLFDFYKNCIHLLNVWFAEEKSDDISEFMTQWIFESEVFGTKQKADLSETLKATKSMQSTKNLRLKLYIRKLFPKYSLMRERYELLDKIPLLLPIMWFVRMFDAILNKKVKNNADKLSVLSEKNVTDYEKALNFVGLHFDFKEEDK